MKKAAQKKNNLKDITFCIPVRVESEYRKRNLFTLLEYLNKEIETNFIILEADEERKINLPTKFSEIDYVFVQDYDSIFHRTKYINQMLNRSKTPYVAIWDTDAIAPIEQIIKAYHSLLHKGTTLVYPFSGTFYEIDEELSDLFCINPDIHILHNPFMPKSLLNGYYSVGGAYMINKEKYQKAGGENQNFYGWGPEDSERIARMQILEEKTERIDGPLYHLFHTRGHNSSYANIDTSINTKHEFCKICEMIPSELKEYIKTWEWTH